MSKSALDATVYSVCTFSGHEPVVLATYEKTSSGLTAAVHLCQAEGRHREAAVFDGSKIIFERNPFSAAYAHLDSGPTTITKLAAGARTKRRESND